VTKIYTKFGDDGETHLLGGAVVAKTDVMIELYGSLDELNSFLGWAIESMHASPNEQNLIPNILAIQQELFVLPVAITKSEGVAEVESFILRLENEIDTLSAKLKPLTSFVIPGGSEVASRLHIVRCVCRRAERVIFHLLKKDSNSKNIKICAQYLNRLSDFLYVMARSSVAK
jgi:cob(I)alamin adenosyltransferase